MKESRLARLALGIGLGSLTVVLCVASLGASWTVAKAVLREVTSETEQLSSGIAFAGNDGNVWLAVLENGVLQKVTIDGKGYHFPTWAPNSSRLAFVGPDDGGNAVLYVSENIRSEPSVLFNNPDSAPFYIYWSPDSRLVTFLTQEASSMTMRLADAESPGSSRVMARGAPFYWVWSPEGDQLLMHVGGARAFAEDAHISFLENREGAYRVELKVEPGPFQAPIWSVSGRYVFYIATDDSGNDAIYRTDMETSYQTLLTHLSGTAFLVLSPDDQHIAYLQLRDRGRVPTLGTAFVIDTEGKNAQPVFEDWVAAMYWSPDGKKLALLTPTTGDEGPTARAHGLAAPSFLQGRYRWWIYDVETETLELLTSFVPTLEFLQTVPYFDQYHLSLTFWSPDSRYFVVTRREAGARNGSVWVLDTTGQEAPRQIGEGTFAVWSWE